MPTYEYRCPSGHDFEKFYRSIGSAPREVQCPECGKVAERLLSSGAGLLFKGSGFYITDYGKDGKKQQNATAAAKESKGDSAAKSEKSESGDSKTSETPPPAKPAAESTPKTKSDKE
jgi:putative FmdB family regulatory protein